MNFTNHPPPPGDPNNSLTPIPAPRGMPVERASQFEYFGEQADFNASPGTLLEYWRIIQRRKGAVILIAFLGLLAGFLSTIPQTPVYRASTVIEIQSLNEDFLNMRNVNPTTDPSGGYYPENEMKTEADILQSRMVLERAVSKLQLEGKSFVPGQSAWRRAFRLPAAKPVSTGQVIEQAAAGITVRARPGTRLVDVSCDSTNPQLAAEFANAVASEFIEQNLEARWQTAQHTGEWLAHEMEDVRVKLKKSEDALQAYAASQSLLFTQEKDNLSEQKLRTLQDQLSQAQAERVARQSRYELASSASADSIGEVLDDANLKDIKNKLTDLRRQLADLAASYTPSYPGVQKVKAQIATLQTDFDNQRANILGRIRNDYESARRREDLLTADYAALAGLAFGQADKVSRYNLLKRDADTNRQVYDSMLQRVKEAGIAGALRASNIRVVDLAKVPGAPYKPSMPMNASAGLMAGLLLGVVFVVFRDRADQTIQEPGDATFYLGVPELGIIPVASADPQTRHERAALAPIGRTESSGGRGLALAVLQRNRSAVAESFRATLTSIMFSGRNGDRPRVLVLSSASPGEGKTTIATNLALALAEIHRRVLLIDADFRRPRVHSIFEVDNEAGLADLLNDSNDAKPIALLNGHARPSGVPNLSIITSGGSGKGNPTLLHSQRLAELMDAARDSYDMVIIDTPPMLTMADARVVARHADGVVMVARAHQTSRDSLQDACQRLTEDGIKVLGVVLNCWDPKHSSHYGYYRYYDKYKHYYGGSRGGDAT